MAIHTRENYWILETDRTAYAFGLDADGVLTHCYWGARLPYVDDYPAPPVVQVWASFNGPEHRRREEYPTPTGLKYVEPSFKAVYADGVRDTVLTFARAEVVDDATLHITLNDTHYPLTITLIYTVHPKYDLIERAVKVTNTGSDAIRLERAFSASWHIPAGMGWHLRHLTGKWFDEFQLTREPLTEGVKVLESRRITTSHHHNPFFTLDRDASESTGDVYFGALAWSGTWKLAAEIPAGFDTPRVSIGLNDWDFARVLNAGETFTTPSALAGYTDAGYTGASQCLHNYIRARVVPHPQHLRPVLYNAWEAAMFDFDAQKQMALAEIAAELGIELFVMDDGWFKGRYHDSAGLGDWTPDAQRFPEGLTPLIERVNTLGMDFGLWIEPEMVNPDSDLYRAHPDWVIHYATRARTEARNQLILNLARSDVQDYLINTLDALLSAHNIAFIKWDMNRNVSEPGWHDAPHDPRELWVRYVEGVYRVWGTLRERHPKVLWQSCSGGGGRADIGILRFADQIWVSDNTLATSRLNIQHGFSQLFPASVMEAWVTDGTWTPDHTVVPVSLEYRFHAAMCGVLGVGTNLFHLSDAEKRETRRWIDFYKNIRHIVQFGDQYRLADPRSGYAAVQYVDSEQRDGVLFAFRTFIADPALPLRFMLRGLDPQARYTVEGFDGVRSGKAWMHTPLEISLGNLQSTARRITRV